MNDAGNHYDSIVLTSKIYSPTRNRTEEDTQEATDYYPPSSMEPTDAEEYDGDTEEETSYGKFFTSGEMVKIGRGTPFPKHLYTEPPTNVDKIPDDINGFKFYRIKATASNYTSKTSDRRWFLMRTSSNVSSWNGKRKTGKCTGSFICRNDTCSYYTTEGKRNQINFENILKRKICGSCGVFANSIECEAWKMVEFYPNTGYAMVYHYGEHKCTLKLDRHRHDEFIKEQIRRHPNLTPKKLQIHCIKEKMEEGDIQGARFISKKLADTRRIEQLRAETVKPLQNLDVHSFTAVGIFKQACDKVDEFYIFEVNDGQMNRGTDFVFKTSRICGEVGLLMDQNLDPGNPLQLEDAYFDGVHSHCQGFISLGLWLYYRSMRQLIQLAAMEVRGETQENIGTFWQLWNRVLRIVGNKPIEYVFNPAHIMVDNAGANYCGVRLIFGIEYMAEKVIACQWHFLHNMEILALTLDEDDRNDFLTNCSNLLEAKTIQHYQLICGLLKKYIDKYPRLGPKLEWWHV